ncbi:MAG TPA: translocation/assembly module TamB domain-containing protein [Candidatus Babeliales bacterium]|nr:translocation/assembly module TamB domain-containing protein [Candidatus Babeliales bacterium]
MIQKIVIALFIGCAATAFLMQDDPWIKESIGSRFRKEFEKSGKCVMSGTVDSVNLFAPHIIFSDVTVGPSDGTDSWQWQAGFYKISFSWLHLLCFGSIDMHIELDDFHAHSMMSNNMPTVSEHMNALMYAPMGDIVMFIKAIQFRRASVALEDPTTKTAIDLTWHSDAKKLDNIFKSHIYIDDGSIARDGITYINQFQGSLLVDSFSGNDQYDLLVRTNSSMEMPHLMSGLQTCYISGIWDRDHGSFTMKNGDTSLLIDPITISAESNGLTVQAQASILLEYLWKLINNKEPEVTINGAARCHITGLINNGLDSAHGEIVVDNPQYGSLNVATKAKLTFTKQAEQWNGECTLSGQSEGQLDGLWHWHEGTQSGSFKGTNSSSIPVPLAQQWQIKEGKGALSLTVEQAGSQVVGAYQGTLQHRQLDDECVQCDGSFTFDNGTFSLIGSVNDVSYHLDGNIDKHVHIQSCSCIDSHGQQLLTMQNDKDDPALLHGSIRMPLMQKITRSSFGYEMQGEGVINVDVAMEDMVKVSIGLDHGTIRLPHTYNFVNDCKATLTLDADTQRVIVEELHCGMHRGSVDCDRAVILFDAVGNITFVYAPLVLKSCLFNFSKDLFMLVSGRALFIKKEDQKPLLKCNVIVEHAQMKENIFSQALQQNMFKMTNTLFGIPASDVDCEISVQSQAPIFVKTPFLETYAKVNLYAQHELLAPSISGSIELTSGTMSFPYKPLHITRGFLYFVPQQATDPIVELVAKNNIKKYNITMNISGSVSNPHIMFESSPPLSEEQIISLLLLGSQEESLNAIMPALIMQNITNLVFGNDQSSLNLDRYFKSLLQPLKRVHVMPSFNDQTGRGGLRGIIEVDVNDHWRVLAEKNFNLSEDTRLELEYLVSDEMSVRAIRDERRDIGGEVEMRWKF